jgi:medium-chain acyl-[acyl-carrier-protein] hydrolase
MQAVRQDVALHAAWFDCDTSLDTAPSRLRLFCFPYAGAGASIYRPWRNALADGIQVCGVQLPGRGARFGETRFHRLQPLIRALTESMWPLLESPFALFGHSMGALIAFELARELRRLGRFPLHLIVSGLRAPQLTDPGQPLHRLSNDEFVTALATLDGIPDQLLAEPEFLKVMLPTLRADFELCETYRYVPDAPLPCPISAYAGRSDARSLPQDLIFWSAHSASRFSCRIFPGEHFFPDTARRAVLSAVSIELMDTLIRGPAPQALRR